MGGEKRARRLVSLLLGVLAAGMAAGSMWAQAATTTIQGTVYSASGAAAAGTVVVSWNTFTAPDGTTVPAGSTSAVIGAGGVLTMQLVPNAGATPMGSYYTAVLHLSDGTTSRQYWVVPVTVPGGGPAKLAGIVNQVLPTSLAVQTVSKQYVDSAIARAMDGIAPQDSSPYVEKSGDTMTGPLNLPGDPATATQAADKNYVDENITAVASGLSGKVSLNPGATQVIAQPSGTDLRTTILNGTLSATPYISVAGNDGIVNALSSTDCTGGCQVRVPQTYPGTELLNVGKIPSEGQVEDLRGGSHSLTSLDPYVPLASGEYGRSETLLSTRSASSLATLQANESIVSYPLVLQETALAGGSNQFPETIEAVPYFKSTYGALQMNGSYYTQGQHVQAPNGVYCYGVGDCLAGSIQLVSEGGFRDSADEGAHPGDFNIWEDSNVFGGTCSTGCSTGSTSVVVNATAGQGTEGEGRYLLDKNPSKVISSGVLTGGARDIFGSASFSGTNFPVSVFLQIAQAALSQPANLSPGMVTLPISTSGVPSYFATTTAALPTSSGVACVADGTSASGPYDLPNFEQVNYRVVDGTHLQMTLKKVHAAGVTVAVGGLCGYGLEQTVDTIGAVRQVFAVVGSTSATTLLYADGATSVVGRSGLTSAYLNLSITVASIARSGGVVTVTSAGNLPADVNGLRLSVSGVSDPSYNGSFAVTTTGPSTLTYPDAGADSSSSGGTLSLVTGGFALYPLAEVLGVMDPATKTVDGLLTLAPNTVAWAAGDAVEEAHYPQQRTAADTEFVRQYVPRSLVQQTAGLEFDGTASVGLRGWEIKNGEAESDYLSGGGTHTPPDAAFESEGAWQNNFELEAGLVNVLHVRCNLHSCGRWDSGYSLFNLDSVTGTDALQFAPQSDTATFVMHGQPYSFSPSAFTAGTINVGTLNATTIAGGVAGGAITSGTIAAARLPIFGPSGTSHAPGAVPDPGATAGSSRFLREDGTWSVPAGGSGGGTGSGASGTASITGGTIDGTTIGGTTPAAGSFSSVSSPSYAVNGPAGSAGTVTFAAPGATTFTFGEWASGNGAGLPGALGIFDGSGHFVWNTNGSDDIYGYTPLTNVAAGTGAAWGISHTGVFHETLTTPASSAAGCNAGDFTDDANFHYVCVAANTWKRVALSSF